VRNDGGVRRRRTCHVCPACPESRAARGEQDTR
jgi:hypothetical protein